jgi:hypothetical protein
MLLNCHYHLHPLVGLLLIKGLRRKIGLNIFEMTTSTSEPTTQFINKELLIFKCYQVDAINIKCPLQWWEKHETCFLQLVSMLNKS